ncbi:hypothetical protein HMPREF9332_00569 [Alloprevotella rava F0323]|uniref:4-alpha-glucanotransferase n=1 Tax=Alloprevotella rava F0323 TaxID=679199 RepID=G5GAG8_9BACT|nr:4-alpha-glucanotransferase [Alloprevotella rava]EHG23755.1 hypothetical protein HMPREF9332_00569 [Alloprevotella rava F0323]
MEVIFHLDYKTSYGEELYVNVVGDSQKYIMHTPDGLHWVAQLKLKGDVSVLDYFYSVETSDGLRAVEWTAETHRLELSAVHAKCYRVYDRWMDIPEDSYLYSSAFTDCVNHREKAAVERNNYARTVRLKVRAPQLRSDEYLALSGATPLLGDWQEDKVLPMTEHNYNEWIIDLDADKCADGRLEFKFVAQALKDDRAEVRFWETDMNRIITLPKMADGDVVVYELDQAFFPISNRRMAGTLIPVFSLRSQSSFGVGDFGDLRKMVDFVSATRQRVLQVLPINDTTISHRWTDSYPYSCISIFALHPQYVDLTQLPALKDKKRAAHFEALRKELNALAEIDYERVNAAKNEYLHELFVQEGDKALKSQAFKTFFQEVEEWLVPYGQYCYLRDKNGTADFSQWPDHRVWDEKERKSLSTPDTAAWKNVAFYYYVQFLLSTQMEAAHDYARQKHVILKGDIPIGVNRHGCDVWMESNYFNLNGQAGAPPDDFSVNGQNWGFPTYNWEAMIADGCRWWVRRFQNMQKYFDAYRIDHVLGFFRIWEIPIHAVHGLLGQFVPSLGMTREEIESYGLHFQEEFFTKPFIADWVLDRIFHEHAQEVKDTYLNHLHDDIWEMKPEYDTQRKVEAAFEGRTSEKDILLRDGLYALISDVLFVRDRNDSNKFHPRITVQFDFIYEALYDSDKAAFNRLYNDYYYRRNNLFWYGEAMKKLPRLVNATRMLVCAEDLGMVPACVAWVMQELRILSLEIQSMPKDPNVRFGLLSANPYRSVSTISTHDMPTLRQWWDEDMERSQAYYTTMLYRDSIAPHPMPGWLANDIVYRHLNCPSMLCILSLQDWLAVDEQHRHPNADAERINLPSNPHHYWRYRMHFSIEELMKSSMVQTISEMVEGTDR